MALVGDDDRLLPGALTRAVTVLGRGADAWASCTRPSTSSMTGASDPSRRRTGRVVSPRIGSSAASDFIVRSMRSRNPVCLSSAVMRTAALPEVCFEAADEVCGDLVLFLRIALDWDVGFLATPGDRAATPRRPALECVRPGRPAHGAEGRPSSAFLSANADTPRPRRGAPAGCPRATPRARDEPGRRRSRPRESRAAGIAGPPPRVRDRPQLVLAPRSGAPRSRSSARAPRASAPSRRLRAR